MITPEQYVITNKRDLLAYSSLLFYRNINTPFFQFRAVFKERNVLAESFRQRVAMLAEYIMDYDVPESLPGK